MEIFLNFVWAAFAVAIVCLWLRLERRAGSDRRRQLIAMLVLIAILFPVISVSDDLIALQTATEVDTCPRRDHLLPPGTDPGLPLANMLPLACLVGLGSGPITFFSPADFKAIKPADPEYSAILNRPPPAL